MSADKLQSLENVLLASYACFLYPSVLAALHNGL
jgi:hypothetical protein